MNALLSRLEYCFEEVTRLLEQEFELSTEQTELARINLLVNLLIAHKAICEKKEESEDKTKVQLTNNEINELFQKLIPGNTDNTFRVCGSRDEASKLYLELTKQGISIDPRQMDCSEAPRAGIARGLIAIRGEKYVPFIISAENTIGLAGSISMKISNDILGKSESRLLVGKLTPIIGKFVNQI